MFRYKIQAGRQKLASRERRRREENSGRRRSQLADKIDLESQLAATK
jgi:hypothetical protein